MNYTLLLKINLHILLLQDLRDRQLGKHTPRPPIRIHNRLLDKHIPTNPRHRNRPNQIIDCTYPEDPQRHYTVQVVGKFLVDALAC